MAVRNKVFALAAAALIVAASAAPGSAQDGKFNAAIERLIMNMEDGPVAEMSEQEKKELVACVTGVFGTISAEKKQYIVSAADHAELRARFDEVGLENRAKLKQQVRDECA